MTQTEITSRLAELAAKMKTHEEDMAATRNETEQLMREIMETRYYTKDEIVNFKASVGIALKGEYSNRLEFDDGTVYALDIITHRYYFNSCGWI